MHRRRSVIASCALSCLIVATGCGGKGNESGSDARPSSGETVAITLESLKEAKNSGLQCRDAINARNLLNNTLCDDMLEDFDAAFSSRDVTSKQFASNWYALASDLKPFYSKKYMTCHDGLGISDKEALKECNIAYSAMSYFTQVEKVFPKPPPDGADKPSWREKVKEGIRKARPIGRKVGEVLKKAMESGEKLSRRPIV